MMSLATINYVNEMAARRSRERGEVPVGLALAELEAAGSLEGLREHGVRIPHLGSRNPRGFRLFQTFFVGLSGFGSPGEPALTMDQTFAAMIKATEEHGGPLYWALGEVGQFQGDLRAYTIK